MGRAQAVGTGVAAADDDDVLAVDIDRRLLMSPSCTRSGVRAGTPSPGGSRPARGRGSAGRPAKIGGAAGQDDRVVRGTEHLDGRPWSPTTAFVRNSVPSASHLGESAIDVTLLHLELGDAVAQQATDAVGPFEHHHVVARPLRSRCAAAQPGRPAADHSDALAGATTARGGDDPALVPRVVDDLDPRPA